jgi:hypothetical protein
LDPRPQLSIGPADGSLLVKMYRDGVAAKAGNDLAIEVTRWQAKIATAAATLELAADPRSLEVRARLPTKWTKRTKATTLSVGWTLFRSMRRRRSSRG